MNRLALLSLLVVLALVLGLLVPFSGERYEGAPVAFPQAEPTQERVEGRTASILERQATHPGAARGAASPIEEEGSLEPAPSTRSISLRVLEEYGRQPLPNFELRLRQGDSLWRGTTDESGRLVTPALWAPGVVSLMHLPSVERREYEAAWDLRPWQLALPDPLGKSEHDVLAQRPNLVLDAVVRREDGSVVVGALVVLTHGWRDARGDFYGEYVEEQRSGADGHARFSLSGGKAQTSHLQLQAELLDQERGSRVLSLAPPHGRGPWPLVLEAGGFLQVEAFDRVGGLLAEGAVLAISAEARRSVRGAGGLLLRDGRGTLGPLAPGPYRVRVTDRDTGDNREVAAELSPGETVAVRVRFDDGETELAAAGRVLDEQGQPLSGVLIWFDGTPGALPLAVSDDDGSFAFWDRPSQRVTVSVEGSVHADRFEPARLQVPFGSSQLVLRRAQSLDEVLLRVAVSEAGDGGPLEGSVFLVAGPVRAEGGWAHKSLVQGRAELRAKGHRDLRWLVRCPGFQDAEGLWPRGEGLLELEVELQPGFARDLQVVDSATGQVLLGGVRISGQGARIEQQVRGDHHRLSAPDWPERLWIEAPGHTAERVDPRDLELVTNRVELSRRE